MGLEEEAGFIGVPMMMERDTYEFVQRVMQNGNCGMSEVFTNAISLYQLTLTKKREGYALCFIRREDMEMGREIPKVIEVVIPGRY